MVNAAITSAPARRIAESWGAMFVSPGS